jgi:hypothetical protein
MDLDLCPVFFIMNPAGPLNRDVSLKILVKMFGFFLNTLIEGRCVF